MKRLMMTAALALFAAPALAETKMQWGCEWQQADNGNYWFRVDAGCDFPGAARAGTPSGGGHDNSGFLDTILPERAKAEPGDNGGDDDGDNDDGGDTGSSPDKPGKGKGKGGKRA